MSNQFHGDLTSSLGLEGRGFFGFCEVSISICIGFFPACLPKLYTFVDGDVDFLREALQVLVQSLMEAEVSAQIGAERYERNENRTTYRNGYRERPWDTRVGTLKLKIPKLRQGSYFPSLLEPRRRAEKALLAVVQEA